MIIFKAPRYFTAHKARLAPLLLAMLAGCSQVPQHLRPDEPQHWLFKESQTPAAETSWKSAEPGEAQMRGEWWTIFNDPHLDTLEAQATQANPGLEIAAARLKQARALQRSAKADTLPRLDAAFGPMRQRESAAAQGLHGEQAANTFGFWRAELGISYEADLASRIDAEVGAASAELDNSGALYRSVLMALQADVAELYFTVRELDTQMEVYRGTLALRSDTYRLIKHRYDNGDAGELDQVRAQSELEAARVEALGIEHNRLLAEHALATLLGLPPAQFSLQPQRLALRDIRIPAGLPSALLERRPDIAAAEHAMAAANYRIGIAKAAYFPRLQLTATGGFESRELGNLFEWSNRAFLLGPLAGAVMTLPLFDGGRRKATVAYSRAAYEEDVARYREVVLKAFAEVEDKLAGLRIIAEQSRAQRIALDTAERAAQLSHLQYREGSHSQLDTIDADRTLLTQQLATARLEAEKARSTVKLIRALGGGWQLAAEQQGRLLAERD